MIESNVTKCKCGRLVEVGRPMRPSEVLEDICDRMFPKDQWGCGDITVCVLQIMSALGSAYEAGYRAGAGSRVQRPQQIQICEPGHWRSGDDPEIDSQE